MKKVMPLFYFSRGSDAKNKDRCDLEFVMQRMSVIPDELKDEVSQTFDTIMLASNGKDREKANRYLDSVAKKYRGVKIENVKDRILERVNAEVKASNGNPNAIKQKVNVIASQEEDNAPKRGYLSKLLDEVDKDYKK